MNKKILGVSCGIAIAITIAILGLTQLPANSPSPNEQIGLVINTPNPSTSLNELDEIYIQAASTGIGRSNLYVFWNIIEPERGEFDWRQSDVLMSFNKKNNLKTTLYFSLINGETLGPFPNWIGNPPLQSIQKDQVVDVLDAILTRYNVIDTVIISGETESQFRYRQENIPIYKELFNEIYTDIKAKHPNVQFGNAFSLHGVINKNLQNIVSELMIGDFVAFSYFPVDSLNEIVKTPDAAIGDLRKLLELVPDKKIAFFEISWSTADFVGGSESTQLEFLEKSFDFFSENKDKIEFFTWYRQYDRPEGTCVIQEREIGDESISVGGGSGLGSSEYVIERLNHYICNAGLIQNDGTTKPSWNAFKEQISKLN